MKPKSIKLLIATFLFLTVPFTSICVSAQVKQTQTIDKNKQVSQEIDMMREEARKQREQREQQKRMLQELQEAIDMYAPRADVEARGQESEPSSPAQERVTSGSTLSQIEAEEREDETTLHQKYNIEMQIAQKEIEMLKKQLSIANKQLSQCQGGSLSVNKSSSNGDMNRSTLRESPTKTANPQKQKNAKKQATQVESVAQPEATSENEQIMQEIESMRKEVRQRRELQEQQRKMLLDLQQTLN